MPGSDICSDKKKLTDIVNMVNAIEKRIKHENVIISDQKGNVIWDYDDILDKYVPIGLE